MGTFRAPHLARARSPSPSTLCSIPLGPQPCPRRELQCLCYQVARLFQLDARRSLARLGPLPCAPKSPKHCSFGVHPASRCVRSSLAPGPSPSEPYLSPHNKNNDCVVQCRLTLPTIG